jgi:DNA-binding CsgD family transcriptional regulator
VSLLSSLIKAGTGFQKVKSEVLFWMGEGLTIEEISDKLSLSKTIVSAVVDAYREHKPEEKR